MAEKHSCLIQRVFVVILILSAVSFLGHFVVDAAPEAFVTSVACGSQESQNNSSSSSENFQTSALHGGFLLATLLEPTCPTILLFEGDLLSPETWAWAPSTLLRPPISS